MFELPVSPNTPEGAVGDRPDVGLSVSHAEGYLKADPTVLTTQALRREIALLRELVIARIDGSAQIEEERFLRVAQQFALVEQQRVEQKADTKTAVDAALQAQKEAVREQTQASERSIAKSEAATSKQLEQLSATFQTAIHSVDSTISDLKDRIGKMEAIKQGAKDTYMGLYFALAGATGVVSIVIYLATKR